MGELYNGIGTRLIPFLPHEVNIVSSTNASPISVTTDGAHGVKTGDDVCVEGHEVNTNANAIWKAVVTSPTTLQLVDSTGNGVGGATGTLRDCGFGSRFLMPTDNDKPKAITWTPGYEGLGDRTALLHRQLHFDNIVYAGGVYTFRQRSTLNLNGLVNVGDTCELACEEGSEITGHLKLGGLLEVRGIATVQLNASSTVDAHGLIHLQSDSVIDAESGAYLKGALGIGDGTSPNAGGLVVKDHSNITMRDGSNLSFESGSEIAGVGNITGSMHVDGAFDIRGPGTFTIRDGATANVDERMIFGASAHARIDFDTANGGRVTDKVVELDGTDGATPSLNHNIQDGSVIIITGALSTVDITINLETSNANKGDAIDIYSNQPMGAVVTITIKSGGTTVSKCETGTDGTVTYGGRFRFGGTTWRPVLAMTKGDGTEFNKDP